MREHYFSRRKYLTVRSCRKAGSLHSQLDMWEEVLEYGQVPTGLAISYYKSRGLLISEKGGSYYQRKELSTHPPTPISVPLKRASYLPTPSYAKQRGSLWRVNWWEWEQQCPSLIEAHTQTGLHRVLDEGSLGNGFHKWVSRHMYEFFNLLCSHQWVPPER